MPVQDSFLERNQRNRYASTLFFCLQRAKHRRLWIAPYPVRLKSTFGNSGNFWRLRKWSPRMWSAVSSHWHDFFHILLITSRVILSELLLRWLQVWWKIMRSSYMSCSRICLWPITFRASKTYNHLGRFCNINTFSSKKKSQEEVINSYLSNQFGRDIFHNNETLPRLIYIINNTFTKSLWNSREIYIELFVVVGITLWALHLLVMPPNRWLVT